MPSFGGAGAVLDLLDGHQEAGLAVNEEYFFLSIIKGDDIGEGIVLQVLYIYFMQIFIITKNIIDIACLFTGEQERYCGSHRA